MESEPRLFYREQGSGTWRPAPECTCNMIDPDFIGHDEVVIFEFKRIDMTDEQ